LTWLDGRGIISTIIYMTEVDMKRETCPCPECCPCEVCCPGC
jgi:hypothetical protein